MWSELKLLHMTLEQAPINHVAKANVLPSPFV